MSTLTELFDQSRSNPANSLIPFCREMAVRLDEIDTRLAHLRQQGDMTVPLIHDPASGVPRFSDRSFNGPGDLLNTLRDMAKAIDAVTKWMDKQKLREDAPSDVRLTKDGKPDRRFKGAAE